MEEEGERLLCVSPVGQGPTVSEQPHPTVFLKCRGLERYGRLSGKYSGVSSTGLGKPIGVQGE